VSEPLHTFRVNADVIIGHARLADSYNVREDKHFAVVSSGCVELFAA
jgi:hypothetical protein